MLSGQGFSSFWVGLGGSGAGSSSMSHLGSVTGALEQAGTEADCNADGSATYSAWYELVPSPPVKIGMAVHPGDHITSKVTVDGTNVTVQLLNATTGGSFEKTLQMSDPDVSSAEWIAEAPSTCSQSVSDCTPLSLADFGTVQFSGAGATTTDGHTGTISDPAWSTAAVQLSPGASQSGFGGGPFASYSGSAGATPSSLSSDGSAFSVAYSADAGSGLSSDTGGASGSGYPSGAGDGYGSGGYGSGGYGSGGYGSGGYGSGGYGAGSAGYGGWGGYGSYGGYGGAGGWGGYGSYGYAYVPGADSYQ